MRDNAVTLSDSEQLGPRLAKADYEAALPALRTRLLKAQAALEHAGFSVVVLLNGVGGMTETLNRLNEWLDARYVVSEAWAPPTEEERERPRLWRYVRSLPSNGRIGLFLGNWYAEPLVGRAERKLGTKGFARELERIRAFEKTLADNDIVLVKCWLQLSRREQKQRLEALATTRETSFRIERHEWHRLEHYARYRRVAAEALRETSTARTPWTIVEAFDERHRDVRVATALVEALERRLAAPRPARQVEPEPATEKPHTILDTLDFTTRVDEAVYRAELPLLQARLHRLARRLARRRRSAIFLFEGPDAAGKGGAIRRLIGGLEADQYRIIPVSAPSDEERAHHYLWRFWRQLPRRGRITIYDRSWYGRVLVERVEGLATREEWSRAYEEINAFERELVEDGAVLVKFWLHVRSAEQLRRFEARASEPWKQHKLTAEDFRNRRHESSYEIAASDMIDLTSTRRAPFTLIPADDKRGARLRVLETICERLEDEL